MFQQNGSGSGSATGVLEQIQEQVSNNGNVLRQMSPQNTNPTASGGMNQVGSNMFGSMTGNFNDPSRIGSINASSPFTSGQSIGSNNPTFGQPPQSQVVQQPTPGFNNPQIGSSFNQGMIDDARTGLSSIFGAKQFANGGLADMGRFGDNQMVHAQSGEMIVPQSVLQQNPQLNMGLNQAFQNQGVDPQRQMVGSGQNSINPMTGQQEYFDLGKLLKTVAPIAIGAMVGPGASLGGAGMNPFISRAITGALTSKLSGGKTKDALMAGLLSGGLGAMFGGGAGTETGSQATKQGAIQAQGGKMNVSDVDGMGKTSFQPSGSTVGTDVSNSQVAKAFVPKTMSGELMQSLGMENNIIGKLLNTNMGEGLTAGLIAQLLASGDEDEDTRTEFERRPFGAGGPGGKLGGITYANMGGEMSFPRRNGGIDPSEGSGRKDDVPAMLMAGEFVLTKDAVKGLGGGNQRKGIQKAYNMMNQLEARA